MALSSLKMDARPVREEVLSPMRFASLTESDKAEIKSATIVPPRLGSKGFGGVLVEYKLTKYRVR